MLNSYLSLEKDPSTNSNPSASSRFRRCGPHYQRGEPGGRDAGRSRANLHRSAIVPSYPDLPMESVFTRPGVAHPPGVFAQQLAAGRVGLFPRRYRSHVLASSLRGSRKAAPQRGRMGHERISNCDRRGQGHSGCGPVGAKEFDDSAPRQSHQSHDAEGPGAGDRSDFRAKNLFADSGGQARQPSSSACGRQRNSVPRRARHDLSRNTIRSGSTKSSHSISHSPSSVRRDERES